MHMEHPVNFLERWNENVYHSNGLGEKATNILKFKSYLKKLNFLTEPHSRLATHMMYDILLSLLTTASRVQQE